MDENNLDWINARESKMPRPVNRERKMDLEVSKVVGKPVALSDPRLIRLVVKWKKQFGSEEKMDNYLSNPKFLVELKNTFK